MKKLSLILYSLLCVFLETFAQNNCNISTNFVIENQSGRTITLYGTGSPNTIGQYFWNFGDGTVAFGQNVDHTFPSSGTYSVCLSYSVAGPNPPLDSCFAYFCDSVNVGGQFCNFNVNFTALQQSGNIFTFEGITSSTNTSGKYQWNFGDGTSGEGNIITHTFSSSGYYNVCLSYSQTDPNFPNDTCKKNSCNTIFIKDSSACHLSTSFTSAPISNNSFNFSADASSFRTGKYTWNFGDGAMAYGQNVNHTFPASGLYNVCLTYVETNPNQPFDSCFATFCDSVNVGGQLCNFNVYFTPLQQTGKYVTFEGITSSSIIGKFQWNFGDGALGEGNIITHIFPSPGYYNVCMTYFQTDSIFPNDTCKAVFCNTIFVNDSLGCNLSTKFVSSPLSSNTFSFSADSNAIKTGQYLWSFGDGSYAFGQNVSHTFPTSGTYSVCLTYSETNPNAPHDSCFAHFCNAITISSCNIAASFSTSSVDGRSVAFMGNSSSNLPGIYMWNFGDGTMAYGQNVNHTFPSSGSYITCMKFIQVPNPWDMKAKKIDTCYASSCQNILIPAPDCKTSVSFNFILHGHNSGTFSAKVSPNLQGSYFWDFGDGTYAYDKNVNHTFNHPGFHMVCLKFYVPNPNSPNDSCMAIACDSILIPAYKNIFHRGNFYGEPTRPSISLYPVPASDILNFELPEDSGVFVNIEIVNHFGLVVKKETNENGNSVDISSLRTGYYFIRIISNKDVYVKEFFKY